METALIKSITRVKNTNNYLIELDKELKLYNYAKNKYEYKSHFKLKLKAYSSQQDFKKIFSSLGNFFRLTAPFYKENIKASLAVYIDYFKLIDSNNQFSFNSLIGKRVSVFKRGWCISYDSFKKEFTKGADTDMISLLLNHNDEMNLKYKIKKYNEDKTIRHKYNKIILKAFTDFCKIEAQEKNDEKDIAKDTLDVQITKLLLANAEKLIDFKPQISDLSKSQLFSVITSVAKGIIQKQKEVNGELRGNYDKLKGNYDELKGNYDELKGNYSELRNKVKENYVELGNRLKVNYKELKGNYNELKGNYDKLKGNYDELKGNYNELKENYVELKSENVKLTKRVTKLEKNVYKK